MLLNNYFDTGRIQSQLQNNIGTTFPVRMIMCLGFPDAQGYTIVICCGAIETLVLSEPDVQQPFEVRRMSLDSRAVIVRCTCTQNLRVSCAKPLSENAELFVERRSMK